MSAHLREPQLSVDMETIVQTAVTRGYTAQGEMFSGNVSGTVWRIWTLFNVKGFFLFFFLSAGEAELL